MKQVYHLTRLHRDEEPVLRVELSGDFFDPENGVSLKAFTGTGYISVVTPDENTPIPSDFSIVDIRLVPIVGSNIFELVTFFNSGLEEYTEQVFEKEYSFLVGVKLDLLNWLLRLVPCGDDASIQVTDETLRSDLSHVPCMESVEIFHEKAGFDIWTDVPLLVFLQKSVVKYVHSPMGCEITSLLCDKNSSETYQEIRGVFDGTGVDMDKFDPDLRDVSFMVNLSRHLRSLYENSSMSNTGTEKEKVARILSTKQIDPKSRNARSMFKNLRETLVMNLPKILEGRRQLEIHVEKTRGVMGEFSPSSVPYKKLEEYVNGSSEVLRTWRNPAEDFTENELERYVSTGSNDAMLLEEIMSQRDTQLSWFKDNVVASIRLANSDWVNKSMGIDTSSAEFIVAAKESSFRSLSEYMDTCSYAWVSEDISEVGKTIRQIFFNMDLPCSLPDGPESGPVPSMTRYLVDGYYTKDIFLMDSFNDFIISSSSSSPTRAPSGERLRTLRSSLDRVERSRRRRQSRGVGLVDDREDNFINIDRILSEADRKEEEDRIIQERNSIEDETGTRIKEERLRGIQTRTSQSLASVERGNAPNKKKKPFRDIVSSIGKDDRINASVYLLSMLHKSRVFRLKESKSLDISRTLSELLHVSIEAFHIFTEVSMELDVHIALGNIITKSHIQDHAEVDFFSHDYSAMDEKSIPMYIYMRCLTVRPVLSSVMKIYGTSMDKEANSFLRESIKKLREILDYLGSFGVEMWLKVSNKSQSDLEEKDVKYKESLVKSITSSLPSPTAGILGVPFGTLIYNSSFSEAEIVKHDMHDLLTGGISREDVDTELEDRKGRILDILRRQIPEEELGTSFGFLKKESKKIRDASLDMVPFPDGFKVPLETRLIEEIILEMAICNETNSGIKSRYRRNDEDRRKAISDRAEELKRAQEIVESDRRQREERLQRVRQKQEEIRLERKKRTEKQSQIQELLRGTFVKNEDSPKQEKQEEETRGVSLEVVKEEIIPEKKQETRKTLSSPAILFFDASAEIMKKRSQLDSILEFHELVMKSSVLPDMYL